LGGKGIEARYQLGLKVGRGTKDERGVWIKEKVVCTELMKRLARKTLEKNLEGDRKSTSCEGETPEMRAN